MTKMIIRSAVLFLLVGTFVSAQSIDDATLKRYLTQNFVADESMKWEKIDEFKERFAVTDDQLHRVLTGIYREAEAERPTLTPKTREWNNNHRKIEGVLGWLPACGDIPVKDLLMNYAVAKENDSLNRGVALLSYLRIADAEEAKNALLRFLVEGDRMDDMPRSELYGFAKAAFDEAPLEKQSAICEALYLAISNENTQWIFRAGDKILEGMSPRYAKSMERLLLLKKILAEPFPERLNRTKNELEERLRIMKSRSTFTHVSTNLAALKTKNFNLPQPDLATNDTMAAVEDNSVADEKTDSGTRRSVGTYAFFGVTALLLLGFGAWKLARK